MVRVPLVILIVFVFTTVGCTQSESSTVPRVENQAFSPAGDQTDAAKKHYYRTATEGRDTVEKAIELANGVLGPDIPFRLRAAWQPVDPKVKSYAVYLVYLPVPGIAFTSPKDMCVFVDAGKLVTLSKDIANGNEQGLKLETESVLAFVLLHESGHLYVDQGGKVIVPDVDSLPKEITESKSKMTELEADYFAAKVLKDAYSSHFPDPRFAASTGLVLELPIISWNLFEERLRDHFGAAQLGDPTPFDDPGYSHPNLELRFLIISNEFFQTDESRSLVNEFVETRENAKKPHPPVYRQE